jgi:hypothetical protein
MSYELWDTDSGNRVATFATEGAASRYIQTIVAKFGRSELSGLSLGEFNERTKRIRRVATGARLVAFADAINPVKVRVTRVPSKAMATAAKRRTSTRSQSGPRERV